MGSKARGTISVNAGRAVTSKSRVKALSTISALAIIAGLLGGCSNETTTPTPEPEPSAQSEATPAPQSEQSATESEEEETTAPEEEEAASPEIGEGWTIESSSAAVKNFDGTSIVTDLRLGSHDGYDRVVIDFTGDAELGWNAQWVTEPVEQGRGNPLNIQAPTYLQVLVRGVSIPMTDEDYELYYEGGTPKSTGGIQAIYDSTFEGTSQVVIGMDEKRPYRIFTMQNPLRLVVDVQS